MDLPAKRIALAPDWESWISNQTVAVSDPRELRMMRGELASWICGARYDFIKASRTSAGLTDRREPSSERSQ